MPLPTTTPEPAPDAPAARREGGQAVVEFALVLPFLCIVLFGVLQFGTAFWTFQQLSAAASEGARTAAISRSDASRVNVVNEAVRRAAPNLDRAQVGVAISGTWAASLPITVTATYPMRIRVFAWDLYDGNLTSVRTARVEQ